MVEKKSRELLKKGLLKKGQESQGMGDNSMHQNSHYAHEGTDFPILILNGVNLNMLGIREPHIYGTISLSDIIDLCTYKAAAIGARIVSHQSNDEGEFIGLIHAAKDQVRGIVINPGAWSHTSLAIADALAIVDVPLVEVHISNIYSREPIRHTSLISPIVNSVITGCGVQGYSYAIEQIVHITNVK